MVSTLTRLRASVVGEAYDAPSPPSSGGRGYLMAWGLIGEPTARVMGSGGATNMNS